LYGKNTIAKGPASRRAFIDLVSPKCVNLLIVNLFNTVTIGNSEFDLSIEFDIVKTENVFQPSTGASCANISSLALLSRKNTCTSYQIEFKGISLQHSSSPHLRIKRYGNFFFFLKRTNCVEEKETIGDAKAIFTP